ncbi:hypothetical protein Peur_013921 [Populus x canadensis]
MAEAMAFKTVLEYLTAQNYQDMIVELDAQSVVTHSTTAQANLTEYGLAIRDCQLLLQSANNYKACLKEATSCLQLL